MEGLLKIFQTISNIKGPSFNNYLQAFDEHQSFLYSPSESAAQHISSLLNNSVTREHGLHLLNAILEQCSSDLILQKGQFWVTACLKTCNQKSHPISVNSAFRSLAFLIKKSVDIPEFSKSISTQLPSKIVDILNCIRPESHLDALKCLEELLKLYPSACGPSRNTMVKFLTSFVDSTDEISVYWSGRCLHLMQQIKSAENIGLNQSNSWQIYQLKIIGSLHGLLDLMFSNIAESYDYENVLERLDINTLNLNAAPVQRSVQLLLRFKNLLTFLMVALKEPFPVTKPINPTKILNVIGRGISVNCIMMENNPVVDNLAIGALLPELHIHLFKCLDILILTLQKHLAVHSKKILRFIMDTLKWTCSGKSEGFQKPYRTLRSAAYETLTLWCSTMKAGSLCEMIIESLLEQIKYDTTPYQAEVTLKIFSGNKKFISKKARKQLHKVQNEKSNISQAHNKAYNPYSVRSCSEKGNAELCVAALKCLNQIISSSLNFWKAIIVRDVYENYFNICTHLPEETVRPESLYWNSHCREELYNVIHTLVMCPHHLCPAPVQLAVILLQIGQHTDRNLSVKSVCSQHLKSIEKIIHPQKECLYFASDLESTKSAFKNYFQKTPEDDISNGAEEVEEFVQSKSGVNSDDLQMVEDEEMHQITASGEEEANNISINNESSEIINEELLYNTTGNSITLDEHLNVSAEISAAIGNNSTSRMETTEEEIDVIENEEQSINNRNIKMDNLSNSQNYGIENIAYEEDESPPEKKSRMENEENNVETVHQSNEIESEGNFLTSILTDFVDELNDDTK